MMKILNKLKFITLFFASAALIGATNVLTGDFGINFWKSKSFWIDNVLSYSAILFTVLGVLTMVVDKFKEKDEDYLASENEISKFARETYRPAVFTKHMIHINRERKKNQYIHNLIKKATKLEHKYRKDDKSIKLYEEGTEEEKRKNKYCRKKMMLEYRMSNDYVEKNIDKLSVKYDKITPNVILSGFYSRQENEQVNPFVVKNKTLKVIRDKLPGLLMSFAFVAFITSITYGPVVLSTTALIRTLVKLMTLGWNGLKSVPYSKDYCQQVVMSDQRFRVGVVKEHKAWVARQVEKQEEKQKEEAKVRA